MLSAGWPIASAVATPLATPVAPIGGSAVDAARVLAARDAVLAGADFNVAPDWRTRLIDWLVATIERFSASLPIAVRIMALLLLLGCLVFLVLLLIPTVKTRLMAARRKKGRREGVPAGPGFSAAQATALTALAEGRLRDCVRAVWLAAITLLQQAGLSPARRARTDWEHVDSASRVRPDLEPTLSVLASSFQRTHFGHADVDRNEAEGCLARLAALEAAVAMPAALPAAGSGAGVAATWKAGTGG